MSAVLKIIGFLLVLFALYNFYVIFQAQIFSEIIQSQTPDFLDFFVESATADITQDIMIKALIYFVVLIIGIALMAKQSKPKLV